MGNIPLLTREGEISIAREIERGEKAIIKTLSKTRLVLNYLIEIEQRIADFPETIQKYFDFNDEELAEDKLPEKQKELIDKINIVKDLSREVDNLPKSKKYNLARGRIIIRLSQLIRELNLQPSLREVVIEQLKDRLREMNELEYRREQLKTALGRRKEKTSRPAGEKAKHFQKTKLN